MYALQSVTSSNEGLVGQSAGRTRSASEAPIPVYNEPRPPESAHLPRSASYTYFPKVADLTDEPAIVELKGTISEQELASSHFTSGDEVSPLSSEGSSPETEETPPAIRPPLRHKASRRSSKFLSFGRKSSEVSEDSKLEKVRDVTRGSADTSKSYSPSRSMSMLRRKSWISTSRSTSPAKEAEGKPIAEGLRKEPAATDAAKRRSLVSLSSKSKIEKEADSTTAATNRSVRSKKNKRPLSGLLKTSDSKDGPLELTGAPALPPFPKSFSTDRLPSFSQSSQSPTSPPHIPPLPRTFSTEKIKDAKAFPRKKDELWTVFRTLDGDFRKFQAKSIALKTNVVRQALLPFLRSYATHPSNHKLRPEDLDRRANILNGWWTGLLELLAGRNNQSISGTDRPAILEAIAGIMERSEWRHSSSPFCALADRLETSSTDTGASSTSLASASSDFLAESVYHNVRNIFIQNLLSQLAFVVDKMALRNAAASLVTFCGKTCAYAFFFCPGVADVLVRLWDPTLETMRRVLAESGVTRQDRLETISDHVLPAFPPTLHSLKFHSLAKTVKNLRQPANPPIGTASFDWNGTWVKRWTGGESEMFYVFVKHFHILAADFLPPNPTHAERVCVPGLVMVHAQILTNLDATINRAATPQQQEEPTSGAAAITFDDVLNDPDATASTLPLPPANATRQMAENRLIMLIRDFLSERNSHYFAARQMFAEAFGQLLKAAARRVSRYDSNACYTLCDFLEEAFFILVRYEQVVSLSQSVLDWPFWLEVCKQMTSSHNTTTEIKLYAFLFSIWNTIVVDERRKASMCLDFLLEPEFFESRFNHWCPMVRSYYMRFICWRVARYDEEATDIDLTIVKTLSDRLRTVWSHYLFLREQAEQRRTMPPLTAPCNPAPGRRFLILRNENPIVTGGPFLSFDGVLQSPTAKRLSTVGAVTENDMMPISAQSSESADFGQPEEDTGKKRWGILRSLIGAPKAATKSRSPGPTTKEAVKEDTASTSVTPTNSPPKAKTTSTEETKPPVPTHRSFSFRFSLEWIDKRYASPQNMRLAPPRLPMPAQIMLQHRGINISSVVAARPTGTAAAASRYAGRSLAEWTILVHECQNFFERRKKEGVPSNKLVETPTLNVEVFRRPG